MSRHNMALQLSPYYTFNHLYYNMLVHGVYFLLTINFTKEKVLEKCSRKKKCLFISFY